MPKKIKALLMILCLVLFSALAMASNDKGDKAEAETETTEFVPDIDTLTSLGYIYGFGKEFFVFSGDTFKQEITLCLFQSVARSGGSNKKNYKGDTSPDEMVRWVSTDEAVATVAGRNGTLKHVYYADVTLHEEGVVEIYAETIDGRLQSDKITIIYGNTNNKEGVAIYDTGRYILSRVKYPTKTTTRIASDRDPFFWEWSYKNRRVYTYQNQEDSSYVDVDTVDISGRNVTVRGAVKTFSSGGMDVTCGFVLKMKYNSDFTKATVTSEKYDVPEIIRDRLE